MDKKAKWICAGRDIGQVSPCFYKRISVKGEIACATAYVSAVGVYNFLINGKKVGNAVLAPGWTSYKNRIQYQEYDITPLLANGENVISILCGKGWALGEIGRFLTPKVYSEHICAIAYIKIEYKNKESDEIYTDDTWDCQTSHILDSEIYHGEILDLTAPIEYVGKAVEICIDFPIVAQNCESVCEHERFAVKEVIKTPKGETVLDFGQNIAGYVEIKIRGERGDKIALSHAEVLDKDGNFYTLNMRKARNKNIYTLSGNDDVLKPSFCFQGFRYVRLDEYTPKKFDRQSFCAIAVYTDMQRTGDFSCGHDGINKLYENIIWGQKGNFVDVPTDCPQRDERLGWTADAQVFCRTACINFNAESFFDKWLCDLGLEQGDDGRIYRFAPFAAKELGGRISAGWSDAAVICPWEVYRAYGNKQILRKHFPMMQKWIEYVRNFGDEEYLWIGGDHYGDWLALDAGDGQRFGATQTDLIASAFFAYTTALMVKICKVLGEDFTYYEHLHENVRNAFRKAFMRDGVPVIYPKADAFSTNREVRAFTQTSLALILHFGLCEESERKKLSDALADLIRKNGGKMTTGFIGTPYLLHALSDNGHIDTAYSLLLAEHSPSWLFSVNHGATTVWEHWDGIKEDGSFWSEQMNSFNHYAYGSVFDWIFKNVGGIDICNDGVGYTYVTISPKPDERLKYANCRIKTHNGDLTVKWEYRKDAVFYEVTVPPNTRADINIKNHKLSVGEGIYTFT